MKRNNVPYLRSASLPRGGGSRSTKGGKRKLRLREPQRERGLESLDKNESSAQAIKDVDRREGASKDECSGRRLRLYDARVLGGRGRGELRLWSRRKGFKTGKSRFRGITSSDWGGVGRHRNVPGGEGFKTHGIWFDMRMRGSNQSGKRSGRSVLQECCGK